MIRKCFLVSVLLCLGGACGLSAPSTRPTADEMAIQKLRDEYEQKWQAAETQEEKMRLQRELWARVVELEMARVGRNELALAGDQKRGH